MKPKILILVKKFGIRYPKHKIKYDLIDAISQFADVHYWHKDGSILDIIDQIQMNPDFIFHYDIAWKNKFSPEIKDLDKVNIPKGCFVIDIHFNPNVRRQYFDQNKIDVIFSATKYPFLETFHESTYTKRFKWLPFAINPDVIKDWKLKKDINFLLAGQVYNTKSNKTRTKKGRYPFREKVLEVMQNEKGFQFMSHPGHFTKNKKKIDHNYAKMINRAHIFFTCGGQPKYPVLKFFEVPGCNTLLLAEANKDILELGFIDKVNFVACNQSNIYKNAMYYIKNDEERKRITKEGFNFIHQNHTLQIRAKQFVGYVLEIIKSV